MRARALVERHAKGVQLPSSCRGCRYHYEMHVDLISELQTHPEVKLHTLGMTTDGHDMDLLQIGAPGSMIIIVLACTDTRWGHFAFQGQPGSP